MAQQMDTKQTIEKLVRVAVATVWTKPESPRELDQINLQAPVKIEEWLSNMTFEERLELCDQNMVQTQVLYGQKVDVTAEEEGWSYVLIPSQPSSKEKKGYPGWIPSEQLCTGSLSVTEKLVQVKANTASLYQDSGEKSMELSFLTRLPYIDATEDWVIVSTIDGQQKLKKEDVHIIDCSSQALSETEQLIQLFAQDSQLSGEHAGKVLVEMGKRFLDLPYLWAGMSGFGYDCSGFVYSMHQALGITIPRDASDQAKQGEQVPLEELQAGDLLFFAYEEGKGAVHHVGMYVGDGEMIHSPKTGKTIEIVALKGTLYEAELCGARRYWT